MAGPDNKKRKCATVIPQTWPKFTGPSVNERTDINEANRLWAAFLRVHSQVQPTPRIYRKEP